MIAIDFYEKTESRCPACIAMKKTLDQWMATHSDEEVFINMLSAEEHADTLKEAGFTAAPVVFVTRGRGREQVVTGNNRDMFIDILDGRDSLWED